MNFVSYNDIENCYRQMYINKIAELGHGSVIWTVSEKCHGCLSFDAIIETLEYGKISISEIVNKKLECHVKSYDTDTKEIVYKKVINHQVQEDNNDWYVVEMETGEKLYITGNHLVYLPELNCWRKVENLVGDEVFLLDD